MLLLQLHRLLLWLSSASLLNPATTPLGWRLKLLQLHDRRRVDQHAGHRVGEENQLYIWYFKRGNVYRPFCTHARTTKSSMLSPRRGVAQSEGQGQSPYRTREAPGHTILQSIYVPLHTILIYYRTAHYNIYLDGPIATGKQRAVALASEAQGAAVAA